MTNIISRFESNRQRNTDLRVGSRIKFLADFIDSDDYLKSMEVGPEDVFTLEAADLKGPEISLIFTDEMGGKLFYKIPYGCPLEEQIQILESLN